MTVTFYDAFAGIGGFREGIRRAHPDWKCVGSCEIYKWSQKVYRKNFQEAKIDEDITKLDALPVGTDILCGGFPCQTFSMAGNRRGFEDTRGTLFFELARLANRSRPKILFLENVKGLLTHDNGRTFSTILDTLGQLGYWWEYQVFDSQDWGLAQCRERLYIVGHNRDFGSGEVFPILPPSKDASNSPEIKTTGTLVSSYGGKGTFGDYLGMEPLHADTPRIRPFTPTEAERLQGFPDGWTQYSDDGSVIPDRHRYYLIGNAVSPPVIEAIARRIGV